MKTHPKHSSPETIIMIDLKGQEYIKLGDLARLYGVSRPHIINLIDALAQTHEVRCQDLRGVTVVNLMDFRRALLAACPVRNGFSVNNIA